VRVIDITPEESINVECECDYDLICYNHHRIEMINLIKKYKYELADQITMKNIENDLNGFIRMKEISHLDDKLFEL
jgi:hypothetical protein